MKKNLLSILLCLCLCLSLLPGAALADAASDSVFTGAANTAVTRYAPKSGSDTAIDYAWTSYLNEAFYSAVGADAKGAWAPEWNTDYADYATSWKWGGTAASAAAATDAGRPDNPEAIPALIADADDANRLVYYIWSGEQLRYALEQCCVPGTTEKPIDYGKTIVVRLMADIDLNGQAGQNWNSVPIRITRSMELDGGGHAIYNLCSISSAGGASLIGKVLKGQNTFSIHDLNVYNANLCYSGTNGQPESGVGLVSMCTTFSAGFSNIHIYDSLFVGNCYVGGLFGRSDLDQQNAANHSVYTKNITNCSIENSVSFGAFHIGSLCGSIVYVNNIERCYSVGCKVISTAGHSGGLLACTGKVDVIRNCFVDAEVYGTDMTGVFSGAVGGYDNHYPCNIISCYSSGFAEGKKDLGGFVGMASSNTLFCDCYSTALVGLRSSGTLLGGFVGNAFANDAGNVGGSPIINFYNCYAAGEVGSTDTDSSKTPAQTTNAVFDLTPTYSGGHLTGAVVSSGAIGGFAGLVRSNCTINSCYYDKQTTAMREWGLGYQDGAATVTGVLTTTSDKAGNGLMSDPYADDASATGFTGMSGEPTGVPSSATTPYYSAANPYPARELRWDCSAVDHYPELKAFQDAKAADWGGERAAALVRACSSASTSGVQLETWDRVLTEGTGRIDNTKGVEPLVYDTVRDIVNGFLLTSSEEVNAWNRIGSADSKGTDGSEVTVRGNVRDVLSLKHQNGQYLCDELVTGIEWLKVTCEGASGGATAAATRRLRVIPTSAIDAGACRVITDSIYDHADDVTLLYSTAHRMAKSTASGTDTYDVTTGVYPDMLRDANDALSDEQKAYGAGHGVESAAGGQNDTFTGTDVSYMGLTGENAVDGELYTYLYEVTGINDDGEIVVAASPKDFGDNNPADGLSTFGAQLNGYAKFPNLDKQYLLAYAWQLSDGRTLMDAKLIRTAAVPFTVDMKIWSDDINGTLCTDAQAYAGSDAYTDASVTESGEQNYSADAYTDAYTAFSLPEGYSLTGLKLTLDFSGETYSAMLDAGTNTVSVPFIVYRIVYRNGVYFTIPEKVFRTYTLSKNGNVYSIDFTAETTDTPTYVKDESPEADSTATTRTVALTDVECDIRVDAVVAFTPPSPSPSVRANVTVTKTSVHTVSEDGDRIAYTLTAKNTGNGTAFGVRVMDFVPEYTHFFGVDASGKYRLEDGKEYVRWFIESLAPGAAKTMTFTVTVDECLPEGTVIRNAGLYETTGFRNDTTPDSRPPLKSTNTVEDGESSSMTGAAAARLIKTDANDPDTRLSGARFQLYRTMETGTPQLIGTYTTGGDGEISVPALPEGNYYWVEIVPPAAYELDATPRSFTARAGETASVTVANSRSDVPEWLNGIDHYAYIIGYPEGDVRPTNNITRAEVATIFFRLLADEMRDEYSTRENSFSDVSSGSWYCRAVSTMAAMGIVQGYPDGTFRPNGSITRAEFAAVAARFDANGNSTPASFADIYEHWGLKEISIAANNGWVLGYEDGTFRPDQLITRAEAMAMTNRVLQRVPETPADLSADMIKWPDNADTNTWYYLYVQEATNSHFFERKPSGYETWSSLRPVRDWDAIEKN